VRGKWWEPCRAPALAQRPALPRNAPRPRPTPRAPAQFRAVGDAGGGPFPHRRRQGTYSAAILVPKPAVGALDAAGHAHRGLQPPETRLKRAEGAHPEVPRAVGGLSGLCRGACARVRILPGVLVAESASSSPGRLRTARGRRLAEAADGASDEVVGRTRARTACSCRHGGRERAPVRRTGRVASSTPGCRAGG